mmetsp:Transcript_27759/g.74718  ORF Transcript_27759/g.74718 Transcript_27759/m.74718 type:complete len:818 (+) Transcript_27759:2-2455(+)
MDEGNAELRAALDTIDQLRKEVEELRVARGSDKLRLSVSATNRGLEPTSQVQSPLASGSGKHNEFADFALGLGLGARSKPVNVCIPMSGIKEGPFAAAGYRFPKPLINIVGRPMVHWVLEALTLTPMDTVWLAIADHIESTHAVLRNVRRAFPNINVQLVRLTMETCGWVETLAAIAREIPLDQRQRPTLCIDCHTIAHRFDILGAFRKLPDGAGMSFYCSIADDYSVIPSDGDSQRATEATDRQSDSVIPHIKGIARGRFSYIKVSAEGLVSEMREKVAISSAVNIGAYGFPSAAALLSAADSYIDRMLALVREKGSTVTPSFHASALINEMISQRVPFHARHVDETAFATVGTPDELIEFIAQVSAAPIDEGTAPRQNNAHSLGSLASTRRLRFCFDIDSTILISDAATQDLTPVQDNVDLLDALHDAGHHIILQTSAGMDGAHGNAGRALASSGLRVLEALAQHGIHYDEIHFGRPSADFYIDAVTLHAGAGTLAKDIGWHSADEMRTIEGGIRARSFNQIALVGDKHIIKSSTRKVLSGEAFYYAHIPGALAHCFPALVEIVDRPESDTMSIIQSRVQGVTFSHMLVNLTLTVGRLRLLLDAVHALHTHGAGEVGEDGTSRQEPASVDLMCANYARKVGARFKKHRSLYETFADKGMRPEMASKVILEFLNGYEGAARCEHAWHIHGDPVFSNAILTNDGQVKLIDMRGALGDKLTTQGDRHYDLSKIYQSLCGYDFMLLDKRITEGTAHFLAQLREVFWDHVRVKYPRTAERDVRLLTAAHFFSIVPLHEERDHQERYLRASESMLVVEGLL